MKLNEKAKRILNNKFYCGFLVGCLASMIVATIGLIVGAYLAGFFNQATPLVPTLPILITTFL
jgi:predicted membrane-bound spermidine synthase